MYLSYYSRSGHPSKWIQTGVRSYRRPGASAHTLSSGKDQMADLYLKDATAIWCLESADFDPESMLTILLFRAANAIEQSLAS